MNTTEMIERAELVLAVIDGNVMVVKDRYASHGHEVTRREAERRMRLSVRRVTPSAS